MNKTYFFDVVELPLEQKEVHTTPRHKTKIRLDYYTKFLGLFKNHGSIVMFVNDTLYEQMFKEWHEGDLIVINEDYAVNITPHEY